MRLIALFIGILVVFQTSYYPIMAAAASGLTFTVETGPQGELPCNKIGDLLVAGGLAVMSGNSIEIQGKGKDGKTQSQLHGHLYKSQQIGSSIDGHAFFDEGPGLPTLDAGGCSDKVDLNDGTTVAGPISSVTSEAVTAAGRTIPMSEVKAIHSGRAFNFRTKPGTASKLTFTPTCVSLGATVKQSKTKTASGDKFYKTHPYITTAVAVVLVCGIATAITLPIVLPLANWHHSNKYAAFNLSIAKRNGLFPFNKSSSLSSYNSYSSSSQ